MKAAMIYGPYRLFVFGKLFVVAEQKFKDDLRYHASAFKADSAVLVVDY